MSAPEIAQAKAKLDALNSGNTGAEALAESKPAPQRQDAYRYPTASL